MVSANHWPLKSAANEAFPLFFFYSSFLRPAGWAKGFAGPFRRLPAVGLEWFPFLSFFFFSSLGGDLGRIGWLFQGGPRSFPRHPDADFLLLFFFLFFPSSSLSPLPDVNIKNGRKEEKGVEEKAGVVDVDVHLFLPPFLPPFFSFSVSFCGCSGNRKKGDGRGMETLRGRSVGSFFIFSFPLFFPFPSAHGAAGRLGRRGRTWGQ